MLLGTYEQDCRPWSPKETPWDFGSQLLKPDLERIAPELQVAFKHYPAMGTIGIKRVVNGPFTFAPDGNPLVGPVRGLRGYWVACGVMAGLSQGGGVGLALATWMTSGDAGDSGMDIWAMDVARYGDYANLAYTNAKVQENYRRRFRITFPERGASRGSTPPDDADPRPAHGGECGLGRDVRAGARAVVPGGRQGAGRGGDVPPIERLELRRRRGCRGPRAGRDDRDLELREVPRDRRGRRRVVVVAADGPDAGDGPDHAHRDAQRRGPDRRRVHGRPTDRRGGVLPVRVAAGGGPPLALVPAPPPTGRVGPIRGSWTGPDGAVRRRTALARRAVGRSRRTSIFRPRRSRS